MTLKNLLKQLTLSSATVPSLDAKLSKASRAGWMVGVVLAAAAELASPAVAHATEAESVTLEEDSGAAEKPKAATGEEEPKVKRVVAPYSMPWQLRPVLPATMARLDNSFAFYGVDGVTVVNDLTFSYRIIPRISVLARLAVAGDSPPPSVISGGSFGLANPLIGAQAGFWPVKSLKLGLFLGFTIPVGMGGGTDPDKASVETTHAAMLARSGFDNPLYMPDYLAVWPGIDLAYVTHGFTGQVEISLPVMNRVRGPQTEKSTNVDLTLGLHAGYFIFPFMSAGLDFRYERWLSTPKFLSAEEDPSGDRRDLTTIEPGLRFHVKLGETVTWRPGLSMAFGLDNPMAGSHYKVLRVDLPFTF